MGQPRTSRAKSTKSMPAGVDLRAERRDPVVVVAGCRRNSATSARCGSLMLPWTAELCIDRLGRECLYEPGEKDEVIE